MHCKGISKVFVIHYNIYSWSHQEKSRNDINKVSKCINIDNYYSVCVCVCVCVYVCSTL